MGIFEESQSLRSIVESSEPIMGNLRIYAESNIFDCGLPCLGNGLTNTHYRIGKLESKFIMILRIKLIYIENFDLWLMTQ